MAFYRRPSPLEVTFLAQDTPSATPYVNQYFVEGVGSLNEEELRRAVHAAAAVIPESHIRLKGVWGFRAWHDDGPLPVVRKIDAGQWDGRNSETAPGFDTPIDVRVGPVFEVVMLEGATRRILFRTHHACTDGAGTIYFIHQVFRALRGEPVIPSTSRKTEWDVFLEKGPIAKEVSVGNCKPIFRNAAITYQPGCIWKRYLYPRKPTAIGGRMMAVIAEWARENAIERVIFRIPADLRRHLPKEEFTASNCTSMLELEAGDVKDAKKFQQMLITSMRNNQDIAWIKPNAKLLHWIPQRSLRQTPEFNSKVHAKGTYTYSCLTTNMGQFDLKVYTCPQFECTGVFGMPIPLELTPLYVSFFQCGDSTDVMICIPRAIGNANDLDAIYQRIAMGLDALEKGK